MRDILSEMTVLPHLVCVFAMVTRNLICVQTVGVILPLWFWIMKPPCEVAANK